MGASAREKCSEAEWNERVREMRGRRKSKQSDGTVNYLKCSVLFRAEPIPGADTKEYFTVVGTSTKSSWRNGLIQDLLSSTSPPTMVETHTDLTVAFQTQTGETRQLLKHLDLSTSSTFTIWPYIFAFWVKTCRLHNASMLFYGTCGGKKGIPIIENRPWKEAFVFSLLRISGGWSNFSLWRTKSNILTKYW